MIEHPKNWYFLYFCQQFFSEIWKSTHKLFSRSLQRLYHYKNPHFCNLRSQKGREMTHFFAQRPSLRRGSKISLIHFTQGLLWSRGELNGGMGAAPTNIGHTLANLYTNILAVGGNTFGAKLPKIGAEVTIWKHFGKFFSKCITRNVVLSQILEKISPPGILFLFLYFLLLYDSTILASVRLREISLNFNKKSVHFVNMWIFNRISLRKTLKI